MTFVPFVESMFSFDKRQKRLLRPLFVVIYEHTSNKLFYDILNTRRPHVNLCMKNRQAFNKTIVHTCVHMYRICTHTPTHKSMNQIIHDCWHFSCYNSFLEDIGYSQEGQREGCQHSKWNCVYGVKLGTLTAVSPCRLSLSHRHCRVAVVFK